ncbi:alpha/beta hydrolase [Streptomyces cinereoruber]|uniref:alpha/beta hydrolase n=1 Tax=Streptomyces cinereoruber TaxID=67260 RepID=UPI00345D5774
MNDVTELKRFVEVHGRILGIPGGRLARVLGRIRHDEEGEPGSWAREWTEAGVELERRGREAEAGRHFNIARFPYVDGPARADAQARTVASFDRWRLGGTAGIQRIDLGLSGGRVRCWAAGLAPRGGERRPVLLLSGGIVSVKEQFGPILAGADRFGLAVVAVEMPGVGENEQRYGPESHLMVSELLDALADRADTDRTVAVMMSFSGHMALRAALHDKRIRGVVTAGAPIGDFFTDADWRPRVPRVTVDTLAHLTGLTPDTVLPGLVDLALTPDELAAIRVPVAYTVSARDEIVPPGDRLLLERHVRELRLLVHDDVHGSPSHVAESRLWSLRSALDALGGFGPQRRFLGLALAAVRARERLTGARGRTTDTAPTPATTLTPVTTATTATTGGDA